MTQTTHKAGTIVMMEEGQYSDFGYCAGLVTLQDCDFRLLMEEFKGQYKPKNEYDTPEGDQFCAWLVATQKCAPLDYSTLWLGSYGELRLNDR